MVQWNVSSAFEESICLLMHALHGPPARIVKVAERGIPFQCDSRGTSHARLARHTTGGTVAWEMLREDAAIVVLLLVLWRVDGEPLSRMFHLFVGDRLSRDLLERVNP